MKGLKSLVFSLVVPVSMFAKLESIPIAQPKLFPEGVDFCQEQQAFIVGSLAEGRLTRLNRKGECSLFAQNDLLISTIGVLVDEPHHRLITCNADLGLSFKSRPETQGNLASVCIFDLESGRLRLYVDLGRLKSGNHLANDVAKDDKGVLYVTDSYSPVIYRITLDGAASIFAEHASFGTAAKGVGLNGIVWHSGGFLLVSNYGEGKLIRIPLDSPESPEVIPIEHGENLALDGLRLVDSGHLLVVSNRQPGANTKQAVLELVSDDGWRTARIARSMAIDGQMPTTLALAQGQPYVVLSQIDRLVTGQGDQVKSFTLLPVEF